MNEAADIVNVRLAPCDRTTDRCAVRDARLTPTQTTGCAAGCTTARNDEALDRLLADGARALWTRDIRAVCLRCDDSRSG